MRNFFENLTFNEEIVGSEKESIVFKLYSFVYEELSHKNVKLNDYRLILNDRDDIYVPLFNKYSDDDLFYVLNDTVINKGKKRILKTRLIVATKRSIFSFFKKEEEADMQTSYIVFPKEANRNDFIVMNNQDWSFYVIKIPEYPTLNFDNIKII